MEALRKQAEILAQERRLAREQALEWSREVKMESDEERERKAKKSRRAKTEGGSGDEAPEPKKKRKGRIKKDPDGEEQTLFSDEEGKPVKKARTPLIL
jgi:RNA polymerase-associated protein CTR9